MKTDKVTVRADSENWADTEVLVKAGDVIHIRAEGMWRMNDNWQPAGTSIVKHPLPRPSKTARRWLRLPHRQKRSVRPVFRAVQIPPTNARSRS